MAQRGAGRARGLTPELDRSSSCWSLRPIGPPGGPPTPRCAFRDRCPTAGPQRHPETGHTYDVFTQRPVLPPAGVPASRDDAVSLSGASLPAGRAQGASAVSVRLRRRPGGHLLSGGLPGPSPGCAGVPKKEPGQTRDCHSLGRPSARCPRAATEFICPSRVARRIWDGDVSRKPKSRRETGARVLLVGRQWGRE